MASGSLLRAFNRVFVLLTVLWVLFITSVCRSLPEETI